MVMEVDAGVYLVLSGLLWAQMAVLLWAGGAVVGLRPARWRLAVGAAFGAGYAVVTDLASFGVIPWPVLQSGYAVVASSLLSHALTYWPLPAARLWPAVGAYYFLAVIGAGVAYAAYNLGVHGWVPPLLTTAVVLAVAELGWGIVQRWIWERVVYLPIEVELLGRRVRVTALLDTGNRLVDPLTGQPVIILGGDLREALLPPEALYAVETAAENPAEGVGLLAETPLASRLRLIPYSTLGRENGLLVSFRADAVRLADEEEGPGAGQTLVAFHRLPLDSAGNYRALIHPALARATLARASKRKGRLELGAGLETGNTLPRLGA